MVPLINATGIYTASPPFVVGNGVTYTCTAIETIGELTSRGTNVYVAYYAPKGITEATYQLHLQAGVSMVTLTPAGGGASAILPDAFLTGVPTGGGSGYNEIYLSVSLGYVSDALPLKSVKGAIADLCSDVIGVKPHITEHRYPTSYPIPASSILELERARSIAIRDRTSAHATVSHLNNTIGTLEKKIALLEEALVALGA